jgi:spermidine/putrescine transport system ATP-binding protein
MTAEVELEKVTVRYGPFTAVNDVSLRVAPGEFFSFLGPSGCGKTTLLRAISGFVEPTAGTLRIGGRDMRGVGPNRRPTALIFQSLALFPLMTVAENVAYGLRVRGWPRARQRTRVEELLNVVALADQGAKRIDQLSGGQKQRVAIARALAVEPEVLLLDEPLSALDLKLRQHMRNELRAIQRRVGITFIYITHDQGEALTMSDRIGVMNRGRLEQVGTGRALYDTPETAFVAAFVGEANALPGVVRQTADGQAQFETRFGPLLARNPQGLPPGTEAVLFVRPERLLPLDGSYDAAEMNRLDATVSDIAYEGSATHLICASPHGDRLVSLLGPRDPRAPSPGGSVQFGFAPQEAVILPSEARR